MTCYHPIKGYRSKEVNESGKRNIVFSTSTGYKDLPIEIPCGQCIGCRLDKSREWAVRCVHESQTHEENCFITLTYSDENLPQYSNLSKRHLQLFFKKLRKKISPKKIRYFACGEYGEDLDRPHYHLCLFGHDFDDKQLWSIRNNVRLYRSETLENIWQMGHSTIGDVTFESAAYIARYCTKKITGEPKEEHYEIINSITGEIHGSKNPEFSLMSRRPGIGYLWFKKYQSDCFPKDFITLNGIKHPIPRYYYEKFENEKSKKNIKSKRRRKKEINKEDNTPARLKTKEKIKKAQNKLLKRSVETTQPCAALPGADPGRPGRTQTIKEKENKK